MSTTILLPPAPPTRPPERLARPAPRTPLQRLWEREQPSGADVRGRGMPRQLADRYAGSLLIPLREDRPTVVANFVSTLDGIVALGTGDLSGGGVISGFHEPDRFVMALLRALADVVVVGAGTLRGSKDHLWTPDHVHPDFADALAEWRAAMHLAPEPTTVIVTASGRVPLDHGGLDDPSVPVVLATTSAGAERLLRQPLGEHVSVVPLGDGPALRAADLIALSARRGSRLILTEGGPNLLGEFVRADRLDEIFLTVAPQLVGRGSGDRLGLVEGIALPPAAARWHELVSLRRSDDHLFLRYRQPTGGTSIVETQS